MGHGATPPSPPLGGIQDVKGGVEGHGATPPAPPKGGIQGAKAGIGHGATHWCQLNVKPIVRQGMNSLSQSESPPYED